MPHPESDSRKQKAVLLEASGFDNYGQPKVGTAAEIDVRWIQGEHKTTDAQGNTVAASAQLVVGQDIEVGSIMWLGRLTAFSSPYSDLRRVVSFSKVPDVKGNHPYRTVSLVRWSDTLPESA